MVEGVAKLGNVNWGVIGRTVTQIFIKNTGLFTVNSFGHGKTMTE